MAKILIIDDDKGVRKQLYWEMKDKYDVYQAESPFMARQMLKKNQFDIALIDLHMPPNIQSPEAGLSLLTDICTNYPDTIPIIMTGDLEQDTALKAIEKGAWDIFHKPINPIELDIILARSLRLSRLVKEYELLKQHSNVNEGTQILGKSAAVRELNNLIQQIAPTDATVYIHGESGTGKELVAREIHKLSLRNSKPFITVNCAALSDSLIEDELFGHEAGAYTGSKGPRKGKFELADKGTIFLDEIAELSPTAQAKLLRILQEGTFERLGSEIERKIDVRIITATHQDLKLKVEEGVFREDLFYRLNVIPVSVPPLRERKEDIPLLAEHFLGYFRGRLNRGPKAFSDSALQILVNYKWKGNIRELRNMVERLSILVTSNIIDSKDLPLELRNEYIFQSTNEEIDINGNYEDLLNDYRKRVISSALEKYKSKTKVAEELGINRSYLYELIEKLEINI